MRRMIFLAGLLAACAASAESGSAPVLSSERLDDRIIVRVNDRTFTCYRFGAGQKYPYFYPVNGPLSGLSLTTESSLPYPHHRSLFFGCDRVNGGNYWQEGNETGQIVSEGARVVKNGPDIVRILDDCVWRRPGRDPIISDRREIEIQAPSPDLRLIDFTIIINARVDIRIEKTNHSLFSARVQPDLSVKGNGTLINADGASAEKGTFGVASPWCDYSGRHCGVIEGIAIFDSPRNPWFPSKWFTRDYGFFSPTPMEWLGREGMSVKKGDKLELRYRVVVHSGDARQAGVEGLFNQFKEAR